MVLRLGREKLIPMLYAASYYFSLHSQNNDREYENTNTKIFMVLNTNKQLETVETMCISLGFVLKFRNIYTVN